MILQIVKSPNPRLKRVCIPADFRKGDQRILARRLIETMKAHKAYGIAANQVTPGPLVRIIAVTTKEYVGAMFNPEILKKLGGIISEKETCLSLKGEYPVPRIQQIEVSFRNIAGEARTIVFEGLGAIVVQHEIDHLNGVLASDYFDSAPEIS